MKNRKFILEKNQFREEPILEKSNFKKILIQI